MSAIPTLRKRKQGYCHKFEGLCKLQPVVSLPPKLIFFKKTQFNVPFHTELNFQHIYLLNY